LFVCLFQRDDVRSLCNVICSDAQPLFFLSVKEGRSAHIAGSALQYNNSLFAKISAAQIPKTDKTDKARQKKVCPRLSAGIMKSQLLHAAFESLLSLISLDRTTLCAVSIAYFFARYAHELPEAI